MVRKKIYLFTYAHANLGDDLFIKTICDRYPNVDFYMEIKSKFEEGLIDIDNLFLIKRTFFSKLKNKFLKKNIIFDYVRKADATVILGGSMFIQGEDGLWKKKLLYLEKIRSFSKKFYIVGANFGPYNTASFLSEYKNFFKKVDDVCFRDKNSVQLFDDLSNIRLGSDVVFNLNIKEEHPSKNNITIIPISLIERNKLAPYEQEYIRKMADIAIKGINDGKNVILHSFCQDQGDEDAICKIQNIIYKEIKKKAKCIRYRGDINESLNSIANSSIIVSTRFHGMILGWLTNSNVLPIRYDNKMDNLLKDFDQEGLGYSISNISDLKINDVFNIKKEQATTVLHKVNEVYENPFTALDQFLLG